MVYVNDQLKGTSPVTYDFTWYGWHRVILRKDGFERLEDRKLLSAPVYLWIPVDLAMELLPLPIRDARTWSYTLTPTVVLPTPVPPPAQEPMTGGPSSQSSAAAPTPPPTAPAPASGEATTTPNQPTETTDAAR